MYIYIYMYMYVVDHLYIYIYIYIYVIMKTMCLLAYQYNGNSCTWAHNVICNQPYITCPSVLVFTKPLC